MNNEFVKSALELISQFGESHKTSKSFKRLIREEYAKGCDWLEEKQATAEEIALNQKDGFLRLIIWSRDCDCVESTYATTIPATLTHYTNFCTKEYEYAEGAMSINIVTEKEYQEFQPYQRDRILEAFENGNTYNV